MTSTFSRSVDMVKPERTGERDLTYSRWHRTLGDPYYMIDLDSVEWRSEKGIVAVIETARFEAMVYKKEFQLKVLRELAERIGVPGFLVLYNDELTFFEVYDLLSAPEWSSCTKEVMNRDEYSYFIKNLGFEKTV